MHLWSRLRIVLLLLYAITASVCLYPASLYAISFPAPSEWEAPAGAPTAPGDSYNFNFTTTNTVSSIAPKFAEWTRTLKAGDTLIASGEIFTAFTGSDAMKDSAAWVYGFGYHGNRPIEMDLWKAEKTGGSLMCSLPSDMPYGMYIIWGQNHYGLGHPVVVNKTQAEWIGPQGNKVAPGKSIRVFGRNLSKNRGTSSSWVYLQAHSGGSFIPCAVKKVNPYCVEFTVPASTNDGDYRVYVHNGHGGSYGWSEPVDLVVDSTPGYWVGASPIGTVYPSGGDDTAALQAKIDQMSQYSMGGRVNLSSGTYTITTTLVMKSGVQLQGKGPDTTKLVFRFPATESKHRGIDIEGDNISFRNLEIVHDPSSKRLQTLYGTKGSNFTKNLWMTNIRLVGIHNAWENENRLRVESARIQNCTFKRKLSLEGNDIWVKSSQFLGYPLGGDGVSAAEMAIAAQNIERMIVENCHAETPAWPVGPNGSRNYADFMDPEELRYTDWNKRLISFSLWDGSTKHTYIANNSTKDTAIDKNKGEIILYHNHSTQGYYAQVSHTSGRHIHIRTDGLINGEEMIIKERSPMTSIPDRMGVRNGLIDGEAYVVITSGRGMGQVRQVVSHTSTSIIVDKNWRIPPNASSIIVLLFGYHSNVVYNNDLQGFPEGFESESSASTGVQFDGNAFFNVAEKNKSTRTYYGRVIIGSSFAPSYFNEMRNEEATEVYRAGLRLSASTYQKSGGLAGYHAHVPTIGAFTFANAYRDCYVEINDQGTSNNYDFSPNGLWMNHLITVQKKSTCDMDINKDNVFEYNAGSGGRVGSRLEECSTGLFRENSISNISESHVYQTQRQEAHLSNNHYIAATPNYTLKGDAVNEANIAPLRKVIHFEGSVGSSLPSIDVPIANLGTASATWSASETGWVKTALITGSNLNAEKRNGVMRVSVDTNGKSAGLHRSSLTLSHDGKTTKFTVRMILN